jgi:hypothetical protein
MRGSTSDLILVDTTPKFIFEGDLSQYRHIKLVDQKVPQNTTIISIPTGASLVTWPSELKPLKLNTTYEIVLTGVGVSLSSLAPLRTATVRRDREASGLVIVDLSDGN